MDERINERPTEEMSRRRFMTCAGGASTAALVLGHPHSTAASPSVRAALPGTRWDAEFDVLVVGSGFAALSAAIEANRKGLDVMVIEKMRVLGGNSAINGGYFAVAGSELQKKEGVKDSSDAMVADMLKAGRGLNHTAITNVIAEGSLDAYRFVKECGASFKPKLFWLGGHTVARTYQTHNGSGGGIVRPLVRTARQRGVVLRTGCKMLDLMVDDDERVVGLRVRDGYRFPDEESGQIRTFRARRGVVLASGGFGQDAPFRAAQDPRLAGVIDSTNHPGATGEAMRAAFRTGAIPVQMSLIQLGPWASPDETGFGVASTFNLQTGFPYGVMIERATGNRFVNELADRKTRVDAMLKRVKGDGSPDYPIVVTDKKSAEANSSIERCVKYEIVRRFETLGALAKFYDIPSEGLAKTVAAYNASIEGGVDQAFGKPLNKDFPIVNAPFYGVRVWPKVHHCMGGVQIDVRARVLHSRDFQPIAGLYAAGEVTGGPHGASRLGSCAITDCLVMGRIAGLSVAANPPVTEAKGS